MCVKNRAAWTLESLTVALREYFFEFYDTKEHPALQMSPRTAFDVERRPFYATKDGLGRPVMGLFA